MDWPSLIISGIATLAAVAGAVVAIVEARRAAISKREADTARVQSQDARDESARLAGLATDAFIRQAEAQEKANDMREEELRPPTWTGPTWVSGELYKVINSSGRTIVVDNFDVKPDGSEGRINVMGQPNNVYEYGDSFSWIAAGRTFSGMSPEKLIAYWRFQDEPDEPLQGLIIPL